MNSFDRISYLLSYKLKFYYETMLKEKILYTL